MGYDRRMTINGSARAFLLVLMFPCLSVAQGRAPFVDVGACAPTPGELVSASPSLLLYRDRDDRLRLADGPEAVADAAGSQRQAPAATVTPSGEAHYLVETAALNLELLRWRLANVGGYRYLVYEARALRSGAAHAMALSCRLKAERL